MFTFFWVSSALPQCFASCNWSPCNCYHLVMTHIAMENPRTKWWFLAGNIIYFYGPPVPWLRESYPEAKTKTGPDSRALRMRTASRQISQSRDVGFSPMALVSSRFNQKPVVKTVGKWFHGGLIWDHYGVFDGIYPR